MYAAKAIAIKTPYFIDLGVIIGECPPEICLTK